MMKIGKHNYESFLIDYMEGNLTAAMLTEVEMFLSKHPDIRKEFDSLNDFPTLNTEKKQIDFKDELKEISLPLSESEFDRLSLKKLEGEIDEDEQIQLEKEIKLNPEKEIDFRLLQQLRFNPNTSKQFSERSAFKHIDSNTDKITLQDEDYWFVAYHSGDLPKESMKMVDDYLVLHPESKKFFDASALTYLKADHSIVYSEKRSLKHIVLPFTQRQMWYSVSSVAAAILIVMLLIGPPTRDISSSLSASVYQDHPGLSSSDDFPDMPSSSYLVKTASMQPVVTLNESSATSKRASAKSSVNKTEPIKRKDSPIEFVELNSRANDQNFQVDLFSDRRSEMSSYALKSEQLASTFEAESVAPNKVMSFGEYATKRLLSMIKGTKTSELNDEKVGLIEFADAGVDQYNERFEKDVDLDYQRNEEGELESYAFKGNLLSFTRNRNK